METIYSDRQMLTRICNRKTPSTVHDKKWDVAMSRAPLTQKKNQANIHHSTKEALLHWKIENHNRLRQIKHGWLEFHQFDERNELSHKRLICTSQRKERQAKKHKLNELFQEHIEGIRQAKYKNFKRGHLEAKTIQMKTRLIDQEDRSLNRYEQELSQKAQMIKKLLEVQK